MLLDKLKRLHTVNSVYNSRCIVFGRYSNVCLKIFYPASILIQYISLNSSKLRKVVTSTYHTK